MKSNYTNLLSKTCVLLLAASSGPKLGASTIDLVLTEYDRNTLVLSGADAGNWVLTGSGDSWSAIRSSPLTGMVAGTAFASWTEPDNSAYLNSLEMYYLPAPTFSRFLDSLTLTVSSEQLATGDDNPVADGTPVELTFYDANQNPIPYSVQFIDLGDTSTVPDGASAAFCLALGLVPLVWLKHSRTVRQ